MRNWNAFFEGPAKVVGSWGVPVDNGTASVTDCIMLKHVPRSKREAHAKREAKKLAAFYHAKGYSYTFANREDYFDDTCLVHFAK